ncbi:MAG TPA: PfkB family carbohydrate kinase, partial [Acidimicrobiales bacterium]
MTVVVVGSANVDLVAYVDRAPDAGETVLGSRFVVHMGGKGANQAVMAARLGAPVAFVGCVGDDPYGRAIVDNLAGEGIDVAA